MSIKATVLFDSPHQEVATLIGRKLACSIDTRILAGFATPSGVETIIGDLLASLKVHRDAIHTIVIGYGTHEAYAALDRLIDAGLPEDRMFVHLGRTKPVLGSGKPGFEHYHPMLHSKIYYMEHVDGSASAFVGSHNLTGFAMRGNNGEAAVLLEGNRNSPEFEKIRRHIETAQAESQPYVKKRKPEYAWWTLDFLHGLAKMADDADHDWEAKTTLIILCERKSGEGLAESHRLYFELPRFARAHWLFSCNVHVFIFADLPSTPGEALRRATCRENVASRWCQIEGLQRDQGGIALAAEWCVVNPHHPVLEQVKNVHHPKLVPEMQQFQARVCKDIRARYEYLFKEPALDLKPVFDGAKAPPDLRDGGTVSNGWSLVRDLKPVEPDDETEAYHRALRQLNPKSGSYILLSQRRRVYRG